MKRVDLIRTIESMGCEFIRHGGKHDWYQNPRTHMSQPVPRHREIKEHLARSIIAKLSDPDDNPAPEDE
jgi:mRNA interferase HicA